MKKKIVLLFISTLLAATLGLWWLGSQTLILSPLASAKFIALGRMAGLILELAILLQLILISRFVFLEKIFGHDSMNRLHRANGYLVGAFLIAHPALLSFGYAKANNIHPWTQFLNFLNAWEDVMRAFVGVVILIVVIAISVSMVRRKLKYEIWHAIHLGTYLAVFLTVSHQTNTGDFSAGSALYFWLMLNFSVFGIVLLYRFLRPAYLYRKFQFRVEKIVQESQNIHSIYISGQNLENFRFIPGQFANLIFL